MLSSVNPAAPRPSTASWNVVPSAEVSSVYSRVVAEAPSPQPAEGSIRNPEMSIVSGSSTTTVGGPASGLPGSSLAGLYADQVVPCDWSNAALTPQLASAPVSSLTLDLGAAAQGGPVARQPDVAGRRLVGG